MIKTLQQKIRIKNKDREFRLIRKSNIQDEFFVLLYWKKCYCDHKNCLEISFLN